MTDVKPCVRCGARDRNASGRCRPCAKVAAAAGYVANKEKVTEQHRAWQMANAERYNALKAANRLLRKAPVKEGTPAERKKARNARWRSENRDRQARTGAAYYATHRKQVIDRQSAYRRENPEYVRPKNHRRRAKKLAAGGKLSRGLTTTLFTLQRGKCACCGELLGNDYHLDHIMPLALGGSNTDDNMQLLRQLCNLQKAAKHPVEFMQQRGYLL